MSSSHVAVSSYAIGPQCDGRFLATLANQTGGNLYIAESIARANDAEKITDARAKEENSRRGANVGAQLADWVRGTVYWPTSATYPAELGQVFPKFLPPLRSDRDTIVFGAARGPLDKAVEIQTAYVKGAYDNLVSQSTKMGTLYSNLATETLKPYEGLLPKTAA